MGLAQLPLSYPKYSWLSLNYLEKAFQATKDDLDLQESQVEILENRAQILFNLKLNDHAISEVLKAIKITKSRYAIPNRTEEKAKSQRGKKRS